MAKKTPTPQEPMLDEITDVTAEQLDYLAERVPLKHGMVALMYTEVRPGHVDPPKQAPLEKPVYRSGGGR